MCYGLRAQNHNLNKSELESASVSHTRILTRAPILEHLKHNFKFNEKLDFSVVRFEVEQLQR